ncbi:MAG: hypothetical protein ACD_54C00645G0002 [uncultured bacterium]|nr:MAG: hypothetical protein ACD_54C00645G0002 [uncultured bacterium]
MLGTAGQTNPGRGEFGNRIGLHIGQRHVGAVVDLVVVVPAQGPLGVDVTRHQLLRGFGVLHDLADLLLDEIRRRVIGDLAGGDVAEGAEHEVKAAAALPCRLEHAVAVCLRGGFRRDGAFFKTKRHDRRFHLLPDRIIVGFLRGDGRFILRGIANRHDILRRALEHRQMPGNRGGGGDHLHAGRSGADHADALAGKVYAFGPCAGMHDLALEAVDALVFRRIGGRQQAKPGDQIFRGNGLALVIGDVPQPGFIVEMGGGDAGVELEAAAQIVGIGDLVHVGQNFGLGQIAGLPAALLQQLAAEGIAVDIAFGIRQRAGIAVPEPGAAHICGAVIAFDVQALFVAQFVDGIQAAKARADDNGVKVRAFGLGRFKRFGHVTPPRAWLHRPAESR